MSPSVFLPPSGSRIVWLTTLPSKYTLALVTTDTPLNWKAVACIIRVQPFVGPARRAGNPLFSAVRVEVIGAGPDEPQRFSPPVRQQDRVADHVAVEIHVG